MGGLNRGGALFREQLSAGTKRKRCRREKEKERARARAFKHLQEKKKRSEWKKSGEELLHRNTEPKSSQLFDLWHKH